MGNQSKLIKVLFHPTVIAAFIGAIALIVVANIQKESPHSTSQTFTPHIRFGGGIQGNTNQVEQSIENTEMSPQIEFKDGIHGDHNTVKQAVTTGAGH